MTKQEEIREAIDLYTDDTCVYPDKDCLKKPEGGYCLSDNDSYTCLMKRFTELGVVIKVDRELPCSRCKGSGLKEVGIVEEGIFRGRNIDCAACKGTGKVGRVEIEPLRDNLNYLREHIEETEGK